MQIEKESLPDFWTGAATVGTTPVQLSSATQTIRKGIYIRVSVLPTGALVSVGKTTNVANDGFIIPAGQTSPMLYIDDLSKVWLHSTEADTLITWIAF